MNSPASHERYMRMALRQAETAREAGEVPAGCVIVHRPAAAEPAQPARVVARAHNQVERLKDPTAHAEMIAITQAAAALGDWRLTDTTLYVTKEPCAMCAGAIVLARIPRVVFGVADPKRGGAVSVFGILNHPDLIHRAEVVSGVLEEECRAMLQEFFQTRRSLSGPPQPPTVRPTPETTP
jgi:tRNA(adenine34) deaminase